MKRPLKKLLFLISKARNFHVLAPNIQVHYRWKIRCRFRSNVYGRILLDPSEGSRHLCCKSRLPAVGIALRK